MHSSIDSPNEDIENNEAVQAIDLGLDSIKQSIDKINNSSVNSTLSYPNTPKTEIKKKNSRNRSKINLVSSLYNSNNQIDKDSIKGLTKGLIKSI